MRILMVEEEERIRLFLVRAFTAEGYTVDHLADREFALRHTLTHECDLVVMDLGAARPERLGVLQRFHDALPELPVIVLSDAEDLPTKLQSFRLGAVDYLTKPFSIDELLARARVHLNRTSVEAATELQAGPLTLDAQAREARIDGTVISLSDREFRLLRHLVAHAGQVVSRERLLSAVWGYDFDPHSNVVEVCVRRLRQRLGPDAPIETVRNAGYRIALGYGAREALQRAQSRLERAAS